MIDMAKKQIYPAVMSYTKEVCQTIASMKSINIENSDFNFVLAGVVAPCEDTNFNYEEFKKEIRLQENAEEIKLKYLAKGDFLNCLNSKKLLTFFEFLYNH